jgi:OST-HTH/LOTUS domain
MKGSTSDLLRDNCDEFIYYEDLERQEQNEQQLATDLDSYLPPNLPERQREVFSLFVEACNALRRENQEVLYASMIKDTMKRKKPSFDESYYGYRSFTHLLEEADNLALADIERNPKSGTYVVTRFCGEREDKVPASLPSPGAAPGQASGFTPPARRDRRKLTRHRR